MFYFVKTPWLVKKHLYPNYTWEIPRNDRRLYITFDDGPHPEITPFVLDQLRNFEAKATFFCIGKNVSLYPEVYSRIILDGHSVGNHTHDHLNGWETNDENYLTNIHKASKYIDSHLFRPPYGRISRFQAKQVIEKFGYRIIMWTVLSGDFDPHLTPENCWKNVLKATKSGSIIVFHDSEKASSKVKYVLPKTLEYFREQQFSFNRIEL